MGKIDIAIIIVLGLFTVIGLIKGFMKQILSAANWLLGLVGSFLLVKPVTSLLAKTSLSSKIDGKVADWIATKGDIFNQPIAAGSAGEQITEGISELGLPKFIAEAISRWFQVSGSETDLTLAEVLGPAIGNVILTAITFIGIFIILLIVLKIISRLLNKVADKGLLGVVNKILGAVLGAVKGLVFVSLSMLLLSVVSGILPSLNDFLVADLRLGTEGFGLGKYFFENNPLVALLKGSFNFKDILSNFQ